MQVKYKEGNWLQKQSFWTRMIIYFFIFLLANFIAEAFVMYLFDKVVIWDLPSTDLKRKVGSIVSGALMAAIGLTVILKVFKSDKSNSNKVGNGH